MYTSIHRPRSLSACSEDSTLGPYPEAIMADAKTEVKPAVVGNVAASSSSSRRQSSSSAALSERSCGAMSSRGMRELWLCMLELQETYGCYKSTRMALAMGSGDDPTALMRKFQPLFYPPFPSSYFFQFIGENSY